MKNRFNKITEKILFFIPFLAFILYTNVVFSFARNSNSGFVSIIINCFNKLYMKGPYIFLTISLILAIYVLINGSGKQKLITFATIIGCTLMFLNLDEVSIEIGFLTILLSLSSYLMGILYPMSIYIFIKDKDITFIQKKIISVVKSITIYLVIIFVLAALSNTNQYSYIIAKQGVTGWIRSTNGLGHALVFLLPLFVLLYVKDKKHRYLFYIIGIAILDLLIGTKACYYGLISTLVITNLYLLIDFVKKKHYHYFKLISLIIVLGSAIIISSNLYVTHNIEESILSNTNEQGQVNIVNFVISNRQDNFNTIKPVFNNSDLPTKIFGLGLYYPRFDFIYVEFDLIDILYSRGIYGLILYVTFFGIFLISILKKSFTKINKRFDIDYVLMILTIGYIGFASLFVGHVMFNLMSLTVAIITIYYYAFTINKEPKKISKIKRK